MSNRLPGYILFGSRDSRTPEYSGKVEMTRTPMDMRLIAPEDSTFTGDTMEDAEAAAKRGIGSAYKAHSYGEIPENSPAPVDSGFGLFEQFPPRVAKEPVHD